MDPSSNPQHQRPVSQHSSAEPASERAKVLVLASQAGATDDLVSLLRGVADIREIESIDDAVGILRAEHFDAIFSDTVDFLPLERALVKQQASLVLNALGEGVCIVDMAGRCTFSNRRMREWPKRVHEKIRHTCLDALEYFRSQGQSPGSQGQSPGSQAPAAAGGQMPPRHYTLGVDDQQYFEMLASPITNSSGQVVQIVAAIWDATAARRLQLRVNAIDKAGREMMRMETGAVDRMHMADRLQMIEEKIIHFAKELLHFDHFIIRRLDPNTRRLELLVGVGIPEEARNIPLYASTEGNGISGLVATTGKSYLCRDVETDPHYVKGLDKARSSLTVPLFLFDNKVVGIFNIESREKDAFTEDDQQIAEIFGHYIAVVLHVFDLLIHENVNVRHTVADDLNVEVAEPLNDICKELSLLKLDCEQIGNEKVYTRVQEIIAKADLVRACLRPTVEGIHHILGTGEARGGHDPLISGSCILVADDDDIMRQAICDILRRYGAVVRSVHNGTQAIKLAKEEHFDLVISDVRMPDLSGLDVYKAVKEMHPNLPVILTTAFGHDPAHSVIEATKRGPVGTLYKPFYARELLEVTRKALAQSRLGHG